MKRLSLISSTAPSVCPWEKERHVSGIISVKQFINRLSIFWRNMNAVTILSLPLWCWSAVGVPGCWQVVSRVFLWFSVLLYGWQGVVMVTRVFLWFFCVAMRLPEYFYDYQDVSMVNRVLLLLPGCIFAFLCVAMWLPGCCYGYQGVVMQLPGCFYG